MLNTRPPFGCDPFDFASGFQHYHMARCSWQLPSVHQVIKLSPKRELMYKRTEHESPKTRMLPEPPPTHTHTHAHHPHT